MTLYDYGQQKWGWKWKIDHKDMPRHGHKHTEYKLCLSMMIVMCIKQHLSNIWSPVHEKVKQHWGWAEKKVLLFKKTCS